MTGTRYAGHHAAPGDGADWNPAGQLAARFTEWVPRQRWFGGKGRPISITARRIGGLVKADLSDERDSGAPLGVWLAEVTYGDDGTTDLYQVPISAYGARIEPLDHALIGVIDRDGVPLFIYDAPYDKYVTGRWLAGVRAGEDAGPLHFERIVEAADVPVDATSMVLTGEQSNTSLVFGDTAIMKVFRRLEPGTNPDIEVHAALSRQGGANIAGLLGSVAADGVFDPALEGGAPTSLAMVQEFMTTATDGWELAKISVRDLLAEADLHAEEAGGDFAGEAERLGAATAAVHADLAAAFGTVELDAAELADRAAQMRARLEVAVTIVPQLDRIAEPLRATFAALAGVPGPVPAQRVHGDLHLGQCLRTARRWVLLDFEGEPAKTIASRRAYDSALRDVAGMLRSFDYVARHQIVDVGTTLQGEYRSSEWAARNRDAFCRGYAQVAGADPREQAVLLRAFEADKAVYEAVYEARNRPTWLGIPLASLHRIAEATATA